MKYQAHFTYISHLSACALSYDLKVNCIWVKTRHSKHPNPLEDNSYPEEASLCHLLIYVCILAQGISWVASVKAYLVHSWAHVTHPLGQDPMSLTPLPLGWTPQRIDAILGRFLLYNSCHYSCVANLLLLSKQSQVINGGILNQLAWYVWYHMECLDLILSNLFSCY